MENNGKRFLKYFVPIIQQINIIKSMLSFKSHDIALSLSYSIISSGEFGALGRRFESCRPDSFIAVSLS